MYLIMGGGNANRWHDRMYVDCTLVATQLLPQWHIYNSLKVVATCHYKISPTKIKHG